MSDFLLKLGKEGEDTVCKALLNQGYKIVARNEYTKYGEIDIVSKKHDHLLFIEVKTRTSFRFGYGDEAVNYYKQKHFCKSVLCWIGQNKKEDYEVRLKVATVHFDQNSAPKITWLRML